jgi:cytochrome P450
MIDFSDPQFLADPYPALAGARERAPGFLARKARGAGQEVWFLTRWADVSAAQRDRRVGRVLGPRITREELGFTWDFDWTPYFEIEQWSLLMLEPPDHTRIRRLVSKEFTPRRVEGLRPLARATATRLAEECRERDTFDLLADFAQPYSVAVICALLGAPVADAPLLLDWSHRIVKMYELDTTEAQARAAVAAAQEFGAWSSQLLAERRTQPREDLITGLAHARTEDGVLSDAEVIATIVLLLNAGHEATVNTLGNGVSALLQHPQQWARLASGEVPARVAIEELMRFDPPLQLFERWVLEDGVTYAGRTLQRGDKIALLFGSANRDPRHFADPDTLDIARGDRTHVTFGAGTHHCIGAPLARLELDEALDVLVGTMPQLSAAGEPRRHPAFVIHGFQSVPLAPRGCGGP